MAQEEGSARLEALSGDIFGAIFAFLPPASYTALVCASRALHTSLTRDATYTEAIFRSLYRGLVHPHASFYVVLRPSVRGQDAAVSHVPCCCLSVQVAHRHAVVVPFSDAHNCCA